MLELTPNPDHVNILTDVESERLRAEHPGLWASPWDSCSTCHFEQGGEKAFRWYKPGNREEITDWQCNCLEQWIMHRWLLARGIPLKYQLLGDEDAGFVPQRVKDAVKNYVDHADGYVTRGRSLILHSRDPGTGKSLMAVLLLKKLLYAGFDGTFASMNTIKDMYSAGWRSTEDKNFFEKRIMNAKVLILDDLGKEAPGDKNMPAFVKALIDRMIRYRVAASAPTIITSNCTLEELEVVYGRYIMSLLSESSDFVDCDGFDFRGFNSKEREDEEMALGLSRPIVWQ